MMSRRCQTGYTMIEMIVSISIITIMLGIIVGTYSFGRRYDTLKAETDKLTSAVRNVRARAFNGALFARSSLACSLASTTPCLTNADCSNLNLSVQNGHCTNLIYPLRGYGLHIVVDSAEEKSRVTYFADLSNSDGLLPYYDAGTEKIEEPVSSVKFILGTSGATEAEIVFSTSAVAVYEKVGGSWADAALSAQGEYMIQVEDFTIEGCVKGKRGIVTIDTNTLTTYESFVSC